MCVLPTEKKQSPVRLDDPALIPQHLVRRLNSIADVLQGAKSVDHLRADPQFSAIAADLNDDLLSHKLRAYHCTKQLYPGFFEERGLRPLNAAKHIEEFLAYGQNNFAPELQQRFQEAYDKWLCGPKIGHREGLLWFCMSPCLVKDSGTDSFFTYYGGEVLNLPFQSDGPCLEALRNLGEPVVVEVAVPATDFENGHKYPFARVMLSCFVRQEMNSLFPVESLQTYIRRPVAPHELVNVHRKDTFWKDNECE